MSQLAAPAAPTAGAPDFPITDRAREALAVTRRGCEELIPEA